MVSAKKPPPITSIAKFSPAELARFFSGSADQPFTMALRIIVAKWAVPILHHLHQNHGATRFTALLRALRPITRKELTRQLRDLEKAGLITRCVFPVIPARVEYSLTAFGSTLKEPIVALARWASGHAAQLRRGVLKKD